MYKKLFEHVKRFVSVVMAVVIVMGLQIETEASGVNNTPDITSGIQYVEYGENFDYTSYLNKDKAPSYTGVDSNGVGYFFGGWYDKVGNTYTPIKDMAGLAAKKGTVVAKFVPAQTMSVKCQNWAGTTESSDGVIVRIISAVDSTNYSGYGFTISKIVEGKETVLGTYTSKDSNEVYSKFKYYESETDTTPDVYEPKDLFGNAAKHFISCTVGRIPANEHGTIICIKPFWDTLDGARVYGLSKYAHVEDGYLGYVNVPVNLNILSESNKAAAGILSVKCASQGLTFLGLEEGVENGKVFDEMEVNVANDGLIKCVGNTSDIADKSENDLYINLRFKRENFDASNPKPDTTFLKFVVGNEDFSNSSESYTTADVWNIIY